MRPILEDVRIEHDHLGPKIVVDVDVGGLDLLDLITEAGQLDALIAEVGIPLPPVWPR